MWNKATKQKSTYKNMRVPMLLNETNKGKQIAEQIKATILRQHYQMKYQN